MAYFQGVLICQFFSFAHPSLLLSSLLPQKLVHGWIHLYLGALRSVLQTLWHPAQRGTMMCFMIACKVLWWLLRRERSIIWWGWLIHRAVHLLEYMYCSVLWGQDREVFCLNHFVCFLVINIDTVEPRNCVWGRGMTDEISLSHLLLCVGL